LLLPFLREAGAAQSIGKRAAALRLAAQSFVVMEESLFRLAGRLAHPNLATEADVGALRGQKPDCSPR
jgi:hypothetical protein